jgi:hypothetical protein
VVATLVETLYEENTFMNMTAVWALREVAAAQSAVATDVVSVLVDVMGEDRPDYVRETAAEALTEIYAACGDIDFLLATLTDPRNALKRPVTAQALFRMALEHKEQLTTIISELVERSAICEPITRIEANRALLLFDKILVLLNSVYIDY